MIKPHLILATIFVNVGCCAFISQRSAVGLEPATTGPQEIVRIEVVPLTLPALVGTVSNPLLKMNIDTRGTLNPLSLTELRGSLSGTLNRSQLVSISVAYGDSFLNAKPIAKVDVRTLESDAFTIALPVSEGELSEGNNTLWMACQLMADANIDKQIGVTCTQVSFSNGRIEQLSAAPTNQRLGVALRRGGDDEVHTYRIPGLATTNQGTLIGVYDVRRRSGKDLPGDIDVGMSRSTDGGHTWEPMRIIMNMGDDPQWKYDGVGDPAVLVDQQTGTIWVAATWSHGNRSWVGSGPGLSPTETGQLLLVRSDDDGLKWSQPINITSQIKHPEWCFLLQGPGKGITLHDGTIVFAAQYQDTPEKQRLPRSTIIYSTDHGKTWKIGTGAADDTTEAQVVEVEPGVLMLNCRYNRAPARVVMTTRDMGQTWTPHATSERALIEPGACMASLIDVDREVGKDFGKWLLFSNPDSGQGRKRLSIKASPDRGLTWPSENHLLLDEEESAGYSCMTMIDEHTIGILYEGSQADLTFQRIPVADVTDNLKREESLPRDRAPQ